MGEFQNKVVQLAKAQSGEAAASELAVVRERVLSAMLELYRATGGSLGELTQAATGTLDNSIQETRIDAAMGDLLQALALLGYVHDIDIIQAGYNTLDARLKELRHRR